MKNVQTKISDEDYEKLKKLAEAQGMTVYEILRYLIAKFLAENGENPSSAPALFVLESKLEKRIEEIERRLANLRQRLDRIETRIEGIETNLGGMSRWLKGRK